MARTPYRESLGRLRKSIKAYGLDRDPEQLREGLEGFCSSLPLEMSEREGHAAGIGSIIRGEDYVSLSPGLDGGTLFRQASEGGSGFTRACLPSYMEFTREAELPNGIRTERRTGDEMAGLSGPPGIVFFKQGRNRYAFHTTGGHEHHTSRKCERHWHTHIERVVGWDIEDVEPEPPKQEDSRRVVRDGRFTWIYSVPVAQPKPPPLFKPETPQRLTIRQPKRKSAIDIRYSTLTKGSRNDSIALWKADYTISGDYEAPLVGMMGTYAEGLVRRSADSGGEALLAVPFDVLRTLPRRLESFEDFLSE